MRLVKLELKIPEVFYDVENKLRHYFEAVKPKKTDEQRGDIVISGGSLCNLYMKEKYNIQKKGSSDVFKDVDVFISRHITKEELDEVFNVDVEAVVESWWSYGDFIENVIMFRFQYQGYNVEIVPVHNINRIFEFDIRFRNFFFFKGVVFVDPFALKDIEEKKLVIASPASPISTLIRVFKFHHEFGFEIDEKSLQYLCWYANRRNILSEHFLENIEKRRGTMLAEALDEAEKFVLKHSVVTPQSMPNSIFYKKDCPFPFHPNLEELVYSRFVNSGESGYSASSLYYDLLDSYQPFNIEKEYSISENDFFITIEPKDYSKLLFQYKDGIMERLTYFYNPNNRKKVLRYLVHNPPLQHDFLEVEKDITCILNDPALPKMMKFTRDALMIDQNLKSWDIPETSLFNTLKIFENSKLPLGRLYFRFSIQENYRVSLWDILHYHYVHMRVYDDKNRFISSYNLRKCQNGKYTISGATEQDEYYNIRFHVEMMKVFAWKLKDKFPEFFDFGNPDLFGLFSNDSFIMSEPFFSDRKPESILFETNETERLVPIKRIKATTQI